MFKKLATFVDRRRFARVDRILGNTTRQPQVQQELQWRAICKKNPTPENLA